MYKHIFFDLDGTLSDPREGMRKSYNYVAKKFSLEEPTEEKFLRFIGPPLSDVFEREFDLTGEDNAKAISYYREYFGEKGLFENSLYPGIEEVLKEITDSGSNAYVVTTKPGVYATQIIQHFGIRPFFRRIFGANLDGTLSAKTDLIRYAIKNVGIRDRSSLAMVGDRNLDIIGAVNNDIDSIGTAYGFGGEDELKEAGATHIAHEVPDLPGILLGRRFTV